MITIMQNIFCIAHCSDELEEIRKNQIAHLLSNETGWDRVKRMYSKDKYSSLSPELYQIVWNCSAVSLGVGAFGAFSHMFKAHSDFLRKNVASTFESQHLARRKLQDTMTLSGIKGFVKYTLRYGSFSSLYLLSTMTVANYNNKVTVWEHMASAGLLGSIFRINFGLKGMAVAGITGGVLGGITGSILVAFMRIAGVTFEDLRNWEHDEHYVRKKNVIMNYNEDSSPY